jgi:hypothetical protein
MIAYGRLIDTRVEISTLSETNNAQFFSELESDGPVAELPGIQHLHFAALSNLLYFFPSILDLRAASIASNKSWSLNGLRK